MRAPGFVVSLSADQEAWRAKARAAANAGGLEGVAALPEHPQREALVYLLRERGEVDLIAERYVGADVLATLSDQVRAWFATHDRLDPAGFKEITGLSRRMAIPLLEWLDGRGVTRRVGDARIKG